MKHNLNICVSKEPKTGGVVSCRNVTLREKLLTRLFGKQEKVPGAEEKICAAISDITISMKAADHLKMPSLKGLNHTRWTSNTTTVKSAG